MSGKECGKAGHRAHTPIVSQKQQGMMGAELSRRKRGKTPRMQGMTTQELRSHLQESAGKDLPMKSPKHKRGNPHEINPGF